MLPLPLPALADMPRFAPSAAGAAASDTVSSELLQASADSSGSLEALQDAACQYAVAPGAAPASSDWRMVLYHERNVVMYNPKETPPFRSKRLSLDEAPSAELSTAVGRCPLCRQSIDQRFAFAAQAYFDLLQGLFRSSGGSSGIDPSGDDIDLLTEGDLYRILGLSRTALPEDIKRAYRKKSLRHHPDKNLDDPDAKLKFQKVAEAFSVLSDNDKRAKYDNSGDMDLEDFDVEQFMNMVKIWGMKRRSSSSADAEADEMDADISGADPKGLALGGDGSNPFLLPSDIPVGAAVASEGGAEAEAAAAAALQNVPAGLLNTGYYARFFNETQQLGAGSGGSVFLCRHVLDDLSLGDYAVKKVPVGDNKAWLRDMIREVKTFERLHHPNIVEYKHSWLELSRTSPFCPIVPFLFILMQYCNGGSLSDLIWQDANMLQPHPQLLAAQIWQLLLDVVLGLQHLHQQGILHRDLKPPNILLKRPMQSENTGSSSGGRGTSTASRPPRALLSDFGTAAAFGEIPSGAASSRGYTGTMEYTAPELLQSNMREFTEKSDMWSLGIVLYAMCFSSLPFSHDDPSVLKGLIRRFVEERSHREGCPDNPEDEAAGTWLPPDPEGRLGPLRLVLAALLAFDADRRPSATDLLENTSFRQQVMLHTRRAGDHAALSDS